MTSSTILPDYDAPQVAVNDIGTEWYVDSGARARFMALIERDGVDPATLQPAIFVSHSGHIPWLVSALCFPKYDSKVSHSGPNRTRRHQAQRTTRDSR